jgi:hypothetical protein
MLSQLYRFEDLQDRGYVENRAQLQRMIRLYHFPPGRMLTPNCRTWTAEEVAEYYASRPIVGPPLRGAAARKRARFLKQQHPQSAALPAQPEAQEVRAAAKRGRPRKQAANADHASSE